MTTQPTSQYEFKEGDTVRVKADVEPFYTDREGNKEKWEPEYSTTLKSKNWTVLYEREYGELVVHDGKYTFTLNRSCLELVETEVTDEPTFETTNGNIECERCGAVITVQNSIVLNPKKGWNPETLEFDGVKVKAGDEVRTKKIPFPCKVFTYKNKLCTVLPTTLEKDETTERVFIPLEILNITAHIPAEPIKSELEEAEADYESKKEEYQKFVRGFVLLDDDEDISEFLDSMKKANIDMVNARKKFEELKKDNK